MRRIILLAVLFGAAGCATAPEAPDTAYRYELEKAITAGSCDPASLQGMWTAYHRWYAVSSTISGYYPLYEAEALLRQGDMFRILGCRDVARASYEMLLTRFPSRAHQALREHALLALSDLAPPTRLQPAPGAPASLLPAPAPAPVRTL